MSVGICLFELGDALKRTSLYTGRFALTGVAAAALYLTVPDAQALGLGRLNVQSALGEQLRAEIDVTSLTPEEASNLRVRIAPPESYRAAGVDYNAVLPNTQAVLLRHPDGRPYLRLTSDRAVQEPFVDVILEISWSTGRLVREYTLLFDPPTRNMAAAPVPAPQTAPVIGSAPTPAPVPSQAPATAAAASVPSTTGPSTSSTAPRTAERRQPRPAAPTTAAAEDTGPKGTGVDEYRVRQGDTLSRIAGKTQRAGTSLDQMLVSLYRGNPQAFIENNMNRLKAGVVLSVPSAETAKAITPTEARDVIQAQSADFGAYRQRLAGGVPDAKTEGSARQAGGTVQATVEDRKQAAAPTPDKLTLSKGAAAGAKVPAPEDKIAKEREKRDADTRVAELSKNVEELKKLAGAASAPGKAAPAAAPVAAAKPGATITAPVTTPTAPPPPVAPAPAPAPVAAAPAPAPAPVVVAPAASTSTTALAKPATPITPTATAPAASAPAIAAAPAPAPAPAAPAPAPVAAAKPASAPALAKATPVEEPGMLGSMFDDNPWALGLGAAIVALLAGFGIYRFSRRSKKDSGETSFLESRLQPDSFFGASGGQRIDTRDAGGASSSMSYSLSQLDAIGDVDPVAEADVYLAYGRDLQAEEILKEAMRSNPDRLAIRTKLLEVYAKRRDTKGFELLATQLFSLTRGEGDDWAKAQELGQQIDPENPLYKPGGAPSGQHAEGAPLTEPLGASTMPQSVLPSPSQFERAKAEMEAQQHQPADAVDSGSVDLDLDLDLDGAPAPVSAPAPMVTTQPLPREPQRQREPDNTLSFDPVMPAKAAAASPASAPSSEFSMDFDLSAISLDLDGPGNGKATAAVAADSSVDLSGFDLGPDDGEGGDPLARKVELAEEFRQIGDMEGARDLLQEVIAKAQGALKTKAQSMLDDLA
jgi:pilus assembly protein FimV